MKGCCCCFNLRTGGLILAYLTTIGGCISILGAIANPAGSVSSGLINVVIGALCLHGIYKNKPGFIIPHIVYSWIGIITIILFAIYLPIDWFAFKTLQDLIIQKTKFKNEIQKQDFIQMLGIFYCIAVILLAISTAPAIYFTMVMQSLYKSIKAGARGFQPTTQKSCV